MSKGLIRGVCEFDGVVVNKRLKSMAENREKLISAARVAFAKDGYGNSSMDDITGSVGLTRGALYHNFGDKRGLLAAVVEQIDTEMAVYAQQARLAAGDDWHGLLAEGAAYIELALDPEVQRIVLRDGPAVLGDPTQWPSQSSCLESTKVTVERLIAKGIVKDIDAEAAARLINGAALNASLWVAASANPQDVLPKALAAFFALATGLLR